MNQPAKPTDGASVRSLKQRDTSGTDVISFIESMNQGFTADFFGPPRHNSVRRLVISAIENFAAKGYHATTTRDIARGADMSPAALYVHFSSKKDLLFKLTMAMASAMIDDLRRAAASTDDPTARLRALVISYVRCNAYMHTAVHVATLEYQVLDDEQHRVIDALGTQVNGVLDECLLTGRAQGVFHFANVTVLRTAILSLCVSVSGWFSAKGPITPEEMGEEYARLVLRMVVNNGQP
ncbi:TetR/AcrR family transcriptional regulator [Chelatococcus reniformis]|uniref:TetR family transcriptional regulator n=1 Tax=Chelatococcus reniformis TaxID=1494448 RepID=A0A916UBN4_9HYPH|nr:TetR/AcrR family transcriptional regulator [Chelatococcus reniformis]GGC66335.1 TetR family transcriptional regulator [Chelatococcus reniformis]